MNILVTLDSNYVQPLITMLRSLVGANPNVPFDVYVAYAHLTGADFEKIEKAVEGSDSRIIAIRVPDDLFQDAPMLKRTSKATYYRLFASMYLPENLERILYIDPDTLILNDISEFYNLDFKESLFAGCGHLPMFLNFINTSRLGMGFKSVYINAGVLLMNLQAIRKEFSPNEVFDFVERRASTLYLADQDVLNALYGDRILTLDANLYNCDERCFKNLVKRYGTEGAVEFVENKTCILHYDGKYKPWKSDYKGSLDRFYPCPIQNNTVLIRARQI